MKRLVLSIVLLLFSVGVYAGCNGLANCNEVDINKAYGGQGGDGYGGDAKAKAKSYAEGGDAYAKGGNAYAKQVGINYQEQEQDQSQYQKALSIALQKQSTDGNKQYLSISSSTKVSAEPAIAPAIAPGDPTAPCIATYGGSTGIGGAFALGVSAYEYDEICGGLEFYRATETSSSKEVQAMRAVTIRATYALLQQKIESELGPDGYADAVGITVMDEGTTPVILRRDPQGNFIQASYQPDN